ncbi:phosphate uptake regulator, PhoU [Candidatus Moduliflexus flocculans]|uniref:Phosphate uptake regulator, PhoU n=1 Tax=Candidatus Moduliflexus flocculans TaxID=1499966 RepID=A0A0S6VY83_9BACT|nr:phosphate uptake regulator, PhoU [Candidatus Moduliflexus flocculans]
MAVDLRVIIAVLKINNDLERIGDLAVAIAERAASLSTVREISLPFDFGRMSGRVQEMLRKSLDALVQWNIGLANDVCSLDDEVDEENRAMYRNVREAILQHPDHSEQLLGGLSVSRYLERIADHATNIAEDVIYLISGSIVRHSMYEDDKFRPVELSEIN